MASGYSIAQMLLKDGDDFCVVKFGTGEEEIVHMQQASHLLTQPLVRPNPVPSAASHTTKCSTMSHGHHCMLKILTCMMCLSQLWAVAMLALAEG